jgi:ribosomal-protein-serine acetyltransferase
VRSPILKDFPESFETERLLIRGALPGDGPEMHAAVNESLEELLPWMDWPRQHETVEDSEERIRRHRVRFVERSDLLLLLFLKEGRILWSAAAACTGWTGRYRGSRSVTGAAPA